MNLPKPAFQHLKEKMDMGGIRSPKYPSTVTKVTQPHPHASTAHSHVYAQVYVEVGQEVKKGEVLVTVEGMKMEVN